ncbi:DUF1775 domain-containing protein [Pseudonocardia xishanensis]|uniref:YncI copper-binding domain-containing protein n=1 Tax=Pseudonocardia xishanensis TaxID=630995 RepID=A0ABP8RQ46_9PSEU
MSLHRRILAASVLFPTVALTALAPSASAQVTIVPGKVAGGGAETLAVRVASQKPGVPTTSLELEFPSDIPLDAARAAAVQGWTADVDADRMVRSVTWSGGRIAPGTFEQFLLTLSPLPERGRLAFTAVQTYADGSVDRWEAAVDGPAVTIGTPAPVAAPAQPVPTPGPGVVVTRTDPSAPAGDDESAGWPPALLGLIPLVGGAALVAGLRRRRSGAARDVDPAEAAPSTVSAAQAASDTDTDTASDDAAGVLHSDMALFERAFAEVASAPRPAEPRSAEPRSAEPRLTRVPPTEARPTEARPSGRHALSAAHVARHARPAPGRHHQTSESETMTLLPTPLSDHDVTEVLPLVGARRRPVAPLPDETRPLVRVTR